MPFCGFLLLLFSKILRFLILRPKRMDLLEERLIIVRITITLGWFLLDLLILYMKLYGPWCPVFFSWPSGPQIPHLWLAMALSHDKKYDYVIQDNKTVCRIKLWELKCDVNKIDNYYNNIYISTLFATPNLFEK